MPTENTPSRNEDEFFLKLDAELIKEMRTKRDAERANAERKSHFMRCPKCGGELQETEYHHVKVDRCPDCNGVWFDAGEVEMLDQVKDSKAGGFIVELFRGLKSK